MNNKEFFIKLTDRKNGYSEYIPIYGANYIDALNKLNSDLQKSGDCLKNYRTKNLKTYRCEYRNQKMLDFYRHMGCQDFTSVFYYVEKWELENEIVFINKYDVTQVINKNDIISMGKCADWPW